MLGKTIGIVAAIAAVGVVLWGLTSPPQVTAGSGQWLTSLQTLASVAGENPGTGSVASMAGSKLVRTDGSSVMTDYLDNKDYVLLYYSASWCGPCQAFTPTLVDFYNQHADAGNFELVFISNDRSQRAMADYMKKARMPWPALPFSERQNTLARTYAESGIPHLVLIKPDGTIVSSSFDGGTYLGPHAVLEELRNLMAAQQSGPAR